MKKLALDKYSSGVARGANRNGRTRLRGGVAWRRLWRGHLVAAAGHFGERSPF